MNSRETKNYVQFRSPVGWIVVLAGSQGICQLSFRGSAPVQSAELERSLAATYPQQEFHSDADFTLLEDVKNAVLRYFSHSTPVPSFPLDLTAGSAFQRSVWDSLCAIPFGETRSYAEIAGNIGKPMGMRAVGQACGKNPIAILVPCHRVISRNGKLGGFSGGLHIKQALLELEQPHFNSRPAV
jgi:O-6-methylguanine DNA methyltransferase